jgi:hypothetical protein
MSDARDTVGYQGLSFAVAWDLARRSCLERDGSHEPADGEIAAAIAASGELRYIAGLHHAPVTAERVLHLWRIAMPRRNGEEEQR